MIMRLLLHRVMEEIEEVVGDKTTVEADDLDKLTYMNQVYSRKDHVQYVSVIA